MRTEVGSASHKSCTSSATTLKTMHRKCFRKPRKITALQAQVRRFEMYTSSHSLLKPHLVTVRNQYLIQIMHATKLVNKKLLISFKKQSI